MTKREESARYRILGAIHRGGMGEILLARQEGAEGFSRKLVLKGLLPGLIDDSVSLELFRREAQLMGRLEHPNVARVLDFTYVGEQPYLAMEYVRGRNFHQVIQRAGKLERPVPMRMACFVVAEALRGLHYAHHTHDESGTLLGIIHRDVSPGNILLSFFGEVKITDFGIATTHGARKHTAPRSIRGKARYAAPEVVRGTAATIQSDIHAAAVVLAEALMGEPLWERGAMAQTLMAIVSERRDQTLARIVDRLADPDPDLIAAIRAGLALDPRDRFASAQDFAEALEAVTRKTQPATPAELGDYLRNLFRGDPDLPEDGDAVISPDLPALSFCRDAKTDPSVQPEAVEQPVTPVQRPSREPCLLLEGRNTPSQPAPARSSTRPPRAKSRTSSIRPRTRPERAASAVAAGHDTWPAPPPPHDPRSKRELIGSRTAEPDSASYFSELVGIPGSTDQEASRSLPENPLELLARGDWNGLLRRPWVLITLGILIGALTAVTGSLLALSSGQ